VAAGPVRETETESGQRDADDGGRGPLAEHITAPHTVVLIDDWEVFVVH
jgi:hypothetical protein